MHVAGPAAVHLPTPLPFLAALVLVQPKGLVRRGGEWQADGCVPVDEDLAPQLLVHFVHELPAVRSQTALRLQLQIPEECPQHQRPHARGAVGVLGLARVEDLRRPGPDALPAGWAQLLRRCLVAVVRGPKDELRFLLRLELVWRVRESLDHQLDRLLDLHVRGVGAHVAVVREQRVIRLWTTRLERRGICRGDVELRGELRPVCLQQQVLGASTHEHDHIGAVFRGARTDREMAMHRNLGDHGVAEELQEAARGARRVLRPERRLWGLHPGVAFCFVSFHVGQFREGLHEDHPFGDLPQGLSVPVAHAELLAAEARVEDVPSLLGPNAGRPQGQGIARPGVGQAEGQDPTVLLLEPLAARCGASDDAGQGGLDPLRPEEATLQILAVDGRLPSLANHLDAAVFQTLCQAAATRHASVL
mmetsp:Transcript_1345/g.3892  ORF Transcript_1345/g.3892 Transcript_1345/m.3892 type:complete len:419 (-) Transcript_1345:766-2022(-)